ncbi:MAG: hypothetical protein M1834_000924 [Cirrosporium novae-zelandiae]|nr:MAG: hypothetical protein M1834_000924 [Cirrosporium novae-zelandiae]
MEENSLQRTATRFPRREGGSLREYTITPSPPDRKRKFPDQSTPRPPRLPLGIHTTSSFTTKTPTSFAHTSNPWNEYQAFIKEDMAGDAIIAYEKNPSFKVVVIKERKLKNPQSIKNLHRVFHTNIVALLHYYQNNDSIFFIYEVTNVSLAHLVASSCGKLEDYEIAAFCKEVKLSELL